MQKFFLLITSIFVFSLSALTQSTDDLSKEIKSLKEQVTNLRHTHHRLQKAMDDILFFQRLGNVAHIDKVELTGPPLGEEKIDVLKGSLNPDLAATQPLRIKTYVFIPRNIDLDEKYPLLVLPHGGVHSNFNTYYYHILRELLAQGYIITAPEYRGSTGYGKRFYESIDYGGLEIQDVKASRDYMIENYEIVDADRIGILGWSHGGLITLMNLFEFPDAYKVGFAGVPVSDLIARMGYKTDSYRDLYSVDYHIGETAHKNVEEYKRRSPAWNAHKLQTPLLIHTNTNDADVNVLEVEHLIKSLKAADKKFEYEIYEEVPGGHGFDRIDTKSAKQARVKIYQFLAKQLKPGNAINDLKALQRAGYGF